METLLWVWEHDAPKSNIMLNYISKLPSARFAETWPRRVSILGSTGSIGRSALAVLDQLPEYFRVTALAGGDNAELLADQALRLRPACLAVRNARAEAALRGFLAAAPEYQPEIRTGPEGYAQLAGAETDIVLSAQAGAIGLTATYAAVRAGRVVALANKESLVLAGNLIRQECARSGAVILPVDSEHNAVFQCLLGQYARGLPERLEAQKIPGSTVPPPCAALRRLILTASGGPFQGKDPSSLARITPQEALAHPTWSMGAKISIDSATLMNKGMEYVEACRLYGLAPEEVEVLIHPQSVVHSLVEFQDSSRLAQLSVPDMRVPIAHCLGWPYRLNIGVPALDLAAFPALQFFTPNRNAFPALEYWREALTEGRGLTVALNAANEVAVALFLAEKISFTQITRIAGLTLEKWDEQREPVDLETITFMDEKARRLASGLALELARAKSG